VTVSSITDFPEAKTGIAYTVTGFKIPVLLMARALDIGGSERQMTEIAKALDRSLFEPHVGCFRPAGIRGDELRAAGVPVVQFPLRSYRSPRVITEARHLARYVRDHGIRIVHTWDTPLTVFAIPAARMMTKAIALSSQRSHRELHPGIYRRLTRLSDRFAHGVVVNCEFVRRHLVEDERVAPRKIHVCYNGIDLERFRRSADAPHPLTIGTVCALRPEKDLTTLIGAFARVRKLNPELRLVLVGGGSELAALQQYAREAGVADSCHFEPTTPRVPEWLSSIDIFVLPSRSEAFSNSLMEAMACGCCVVASDVGGNPELVKPGETGLLFKPRDPDDLASVLRTLIERPDLRRDLATRGERFLSNFSIASAARRMGEVYASLVRQ
jgi:glycosyltransferase involved in cell wall biosynthesis